MTAPAHERAPARTPAWWVFWASLASLGYAYVGFPAIAVVRGLLRRGERYDDAASPTVSVVIPAHNEGAVISRKLENILALDYPRDRLAVVVASDGSTDETAARVLAAGADRVRLLDLPRRGKGPTLNDAVVASLGEILVFTDADVVTPPDAMRHLVAPFADPRVGAVAAEKRDRDHGGTSAARASWRARRTVRRMLSRGGSVSGAQGHLYALRRELYRPLPPDVVDDFAIPAQALLAGRRLVYAPGAVVSPLPGAFATDAPRTVQFRRRVRLTALWLRAVWAVRELLNPLRHGFFAFQLLSHKLLRRLLFVPLLALVPASAALRHRDRFYGAAMVAQLAFHGVALLAAALPRRRGRAWRVLRAPYRFDVPHAAAAVAVAGLARGRGPDDTAWTPQRARGAP
jgi:cellulose synthase/poly-beta-1,6-N-acetylglucosamine synthase-like glycosyltransferase